LNYRPRCSSNFQRRAGRLSSYTPPPETRTARSTQATRRSLTCLYTYHEPLLMKSHHPQHTIDVSLV